MDQSLLLLLKLRFVGGLRRKLYTVTTPRGLVLVFIAVALVLWFGLSLSQSSGSKTFEASEAVQENMPLVLFGMCLINIALSSGSPIYFSPAEVNFLFSGPFTRRSLLLYKFSSYVAGAVMTAALVGLLLPRHTSAFVGCFLILVFMQLVSVSASLAIHSMSAKSACRLMAFLGLMVVVLFFVQMAVEGIGQGPLNSFQVSWIGLALLAPFSIFAKTFYATASLDLLLWGSLAAGINASLLTLCIRLDANFIEVAASASQRRYSRWQQVKRTGMIWSIEPVARWRLPQPRHLGGVGPIAWRQLTTALRTTSRPFAMCLAIAVVSGPALLTNTLGISLPTRLSLILCGTLLLLPKTLAFDFRGDVDQLNHLKSLPLRPIVIATGQLVTPVLLFTTIHLVMLASAMPFVDASQRRVFLAMALLTLPLNILLCGLDNLIFLLFPARMVPIGRLDFEFFGRMILDFSTKCVVLAACCVAGAVVGGIAYQMTNGSVIVRLMVTWLFLNFTAILAVFAVTWAFCRFDCDSPT